MASCQVHGKEVVNIGPVMDEEQQQRIYWVGLLALVSQELGATTRIATLTHREAQGHWLLLH